MQITRGLPQDVFPCSSEYKQPANPYYIVAPDYTHKSAGIRLLHQLCSVLNQMGYEAYVVSNKTNGELWTPRLTEETKVAHYLAGKKPIAVYPEVIKGQPLGLGIPVRYVLNYPGLLGGGDKSYPENEVVFSFHSDYYESGIPLYLPVVNIKEIDGVPPKFPRKKNTAAVYYNRYIPSADELEALGVDCIDVSTKSSLSFTEVIATLKSVEILYCFETSAIMDEAILCGCALVLLKSEVMKELPALVKTRGLHGISWGKKQVDIDLAISTVDQERVNLLGRLTNWVPQLENFIDLTQTKSLETNAESVWPQQIVDTLHLPDLSSKEISAKLDRKKYAKVNQQYKEWQTKSTLREIDADIYAEYITKGDLPDILVVIHHIKDSSQSLIADTLDSLDANFLKAISVHIVSENKPPKGFESGSALSWCSKNLLADEIGSSDTTNWVLTLEAGVRLEPNALVELAISAKTYPDTFMFYADEDVYSEGGVNSYPNFKPEFNIELIRCSNYVGGSVLFKKSCWLDSGLPVAVHEVYQFLIQYSLTQEAQLVRHVDGMLFHGTGKISSDTENLEYEVAVNALISSGFVKAVKPMDRLGSWLVEYRPVANQNTTLVVPTGVQPGYMRQMLESLAKYACPNLAKIILVCNELDFDEVNFALQDLDFKTPIEVITYEATQYNYAQALNDAISKASTEYVWVPEIPTVSESGYPGFQNTSWWGVLAPSGTSAAIVKSLNLEITSILNDPEFRKTLAIYGTEPFPMTTDQFSEFLRSEIERAAKLVQSAGIPKE